MQRPAPRGQSQKPRSFPDPAVSIPVLVLVSPPLFLPTLAFAQKYRVHVRPFLSRVHVHTGERPFLSLSDSLICPPPLWSSASCPAPPRCSEWVRHRERFPIVEIGFVVHLDHVSETAAGMPAVCHRRFEQGCHLLRFRMRPKMEMLVWMKSNRSKTCVPLHRDIVNCAAQAPRHHHLRHHCKFRALDIHIHEYAWVMLAGR